MSATQRTRRSRSKTAPDSGADVSLSNGTNTSAKHDLPSTTPTLPSPLPEAPALTESLAQPTSKSNDTMIESLPVFQMPMAAAQSDQSLETNKDHLEEQGDTRSSSLSELGDGLEEHDEPTLRAYAAVDVIENDSEAETERLDGTPRKLARTGTNTTIASETIVERTPSKLAKSLVLDEGGSGPPSPIAVVQDTTVVDLAIAQPVLNLTSMVAESEAVDLGDNNGRKRKRSSEGVSSTDDLHSEGPARKRSDIGKNDMIDGTESHTVDNSEQADLDEEEELEDLVPRSVEEEVELEEAVADLAEEAVGELAQVAKVPPKPRKSKRKGKKADDVTDTYSESAANNEADGGEANEGDNEDDDGSAHDEEIAKKKAAIDSLAKIEKKFKIFREKLCDENLAQLNKELDMLRQPSCTHPEYLAMAQCIDERRAEKIEYERRLQDYKQRNLNKRTLTERHTLFGQYFQAVREIREKFLAECNERIYQLQRGRRQLGVDETEFSYHFPEKRSTQIQQQTAYNLEVSILSGVAKYVGFPAAPEIAAARPSEIEDDLRAMKIPTRPAPPPYIRPYNRPSRADEAAAEEQFIEQTPWANPQHPAHLQSHYHGVANAPSRASSQTYATPAGQRRIVDVHATNGSASTIDMLSNPPSSAAAQGQSGPDNVIASRNSESPVLQMKRNPSEHQIASETPISQPRNLASLTRESYGGNSNVHSSPLGPSVRRHDQSPALPGSARSDSGRPPLTQRNGLGAVSVGSGSSLFSR